MSLDILELEAIRSRWRRAREPLHLVDPESADFGNGGLARFVEDIGVRLLILPSDPEANMVQFDHDFWKWWKSDHPNPFTGGKTTNLGLQSVPTAHAGVRFEQRNRSWEWLQYAAIHRNGGLEIGLGHEGVHEGRNPNGKPARGFHLTRIVGRVWHPTGVYEALLSRNDTVGGPWEATLSLSRTKDARLGDVATGWADFEHFEHRDLPRCQEPNLFFRLEVDTWPSEDGLREIAFQFGEMIEDAWAITDRRWLINEGYEGAGEFDAGRY